MKTKLTLSEFLQTTTSIFAKHTNDAHLLMSSFRNSPDALFDRTINDKFISLTLQVEADKLVYTEALVHVDIDMKHKPKILNDLCAKADLVIMYINRDLINIDIARHLATQEELVLE